jgi:hypothetical protein
MQFPAGLYCRWSRDLHPVSIDALSVTVSEGMRGGADLGRLEFPAVWHCLWSGVQMVPSAFLERIPRCAPCEAPSKGDWDESG